MSAPTTTLTPRQERALADLIRARGRADSPDRYFDHTWSDEHRELARAERAARIAFAPEAVPL